jgi:uncharacterized protein YrrD
MQALPRESGLPPTLLALAPPLRFEVRPGAFVVGHDGTLGRVRQVIVSPGSGELRGLVMRIGTLLHRDVVVPIDLVIDANEEVVRVDLTEADASRLPSVRDAEYVKAPAGWRNPAGRKQPGALFSVPTTAEVGNLRPASERDPGAFIAGKALKRGQRVLTRDGEAGRLDLLLVDPETKRTTHFVVRRGRLLARDLVVPVDWVREIDGDRVFLDVGREQLDRLPEYRPDDEITSDVADALWDGVHLKPEDVDNVTFRVQDGVVELRGVTETEAAKARIEQVVAMVPGVRGVRNLITSLEALATLPASANPGAVERRVSSMQHLQFDSGSSAIDSGAANPVVGSAILGYVWLHQFIQQATGLDLYERQVTEVTRRADRKLSDLFDIAEEAAAANGRTFILRHDLPLTKGLRRSIEDTAHLAGGIDAGAILTYLAGSGLRARVDESVQTDVPRLMAALLVLMGRIVALLEPANMSPIERAQLINRSHNDRPTQWEIERAGQVIDLTL